MRRSWILFTMLLVAAALAGGLTALRAMENGETETPAPQEAAYRMLYTRSRQDFASMTVTLASGESYTVDSDLVYDENGNMLGVYNSLGQPLVVRGQEGFALDSISYQMMLLTAVNLPVTASYPGLDREACGLNSPAARIEIAYHTGAPIVLTIGSPTASGYSCYVEMQGDDSIHLAPLDFYQTMTMPLKGHHRLPGEGTASAASAVQIAVVRPDSANFIAANYGSDSRILPWQVDQPYVHAGSTERIMAFVQIVNAIHAEAYETTVTTMEELAPYGLDQPTRLLVAFSDGTIRDIHLGADAGDGTVYARLDSTGDVYRVGTAQLPPLDENGTDALLDRFVALISTSEIATAAILAGEEAWLLSVTADENGTNHYAINGAEVASEVFAPVYKAVVGIQFDKTAKPAADGAAVCEIRFLRGDGSITRVVMKEYDHHYVQAETSGGGCFLVRRERLADMLTILREVSSCETH